MAVKPDQTASFMIRFQQKIYEDQGESKVQWRGKVTHVQGGEDKNFSDFNDAMTFIQKTLTQLTLDATTSHSKEQQEGILKKSLSLWKTVAKEGPKMFMETIKDPKKQVDHFKDQFTEFSEEMMDKVPVDQWRSASKADIQELQYTMNTLAKQIAALSGKVDSISKNATPSKKPRTTAKKPAAKKTTAVKKPAAKKANTTKKTTAIKKNAAKNTSNK